MEETMRTNRVLVGSQKNKTKEKTTQGGTSGLAGHIYHPLTIEINRDM